ncbi:MAG TPA: hypothetical protein VFZ28_11080 [Burkholderiaceae bacterium]|nr:hypothetical protein [Burkholderiaceae bacterium]
MAFETESIRQRCARTVCASNPFEPRETSMNHEPLLAVRALAATFAVFMTVTTLNSVISIAEPQQSQLIAASADRQAERMASSPQRAVLVARASTSR